MIQVAAVTLVNADGYSGVVREPGGPSAKEAAEEEKRQYQQERIEELKGLGRADEIANLKPLDDG
jgi:hypothetical protein